MANLKTSTHAAHLETDAKPGRRPKFQPGDRVVGRESGPASFRGRAGVVVERTHNQSEYLVRFVSMTSPKRLKL